MSQTETLYSELVADLTKSTTLGSCAAVLGWEEQTFLPPGGTENRANQLSLLAGLCHEISTSTRRGELLSALEESGELGDENSPMLANVREARHAYDKATKLPMELVQELSKTSSLGQAAWIEARKQNDFAQFLPWLEKIVKLKIEQAEAIGYGDGVPYDALLDDFEPGATTAEVKAIFDPLREELVALVAAINDSGKAPDVGIIEREYPIDAQERFASKAAAEIGFNFDEGRLDVAAHPFCSGFGPGDCRITTRYDVHHFPGAFFGVLHEAGHGMYEQGLNREAYGTPVGEFCSLGIHESQSRMWENFVGRSRAFWNHFYGDAQQSFPTALSDVSVDSFYAAVNDVRPSYIRVESDEVTYNLHIMLRFELEQALVTGELKPADVPGAWNDAFQKYFGITPPDDAQGCLQDIHWSGGMIGYFPTYALGNIYAAQFFNKAEEDLGDLNEQFARGEFQPLKEWLNKNIHQHGKQYRATRLVEVVTGNSLDSKPLVEQLKAKFLPLYGLG